jgi:multiple sugar transport system permease protein
MTTPPENPPIVRRFRIKPESLTGWLFIAPAMVGFILFYAVPTVRAFGIGLTRWSLLTPAEYTGLDNYRDMWADERFWESLRVTFLYVLYNIPLQTAFALALAVALNRFGRSVAVRAAILAPFLISNVIAATVWFWLLDPILGFGNAMLEAVGIPRQAFFSDGALALPTVAAINIWRHVGFNALIFYTGLQAIPRHLYEAASLEGAGPWRTFRLVTLPLLRPITVFVVVTSVIGSFQIFDTVAVTTQGGPGTSTQTIMWYIYQTAFGRLRMGYASAMSVVLFLGLVAITLVQLRTMRAGESELD